MTYTKEQIDKLLYGNGTAVDLGWVRNDFGTWSSPGDVQMTAPSLDVAAYFITRDVARQLHSESKSAHKVGFARGYVEAMEAPSLDRFDRCEALLWELEAP